LQAKRFVAKDLEVRPRKDRRGFDLISDALPFGGLWYVDASAAIGYAKFRSRSHDAVIRVYDDALKSSKIARSASKNGV
jgi:hypothetical protein